MYCKNCGSQMDDAAFACTNCGAAVQTPQPVSYAAPTPSIPAENRPLSPWAYFGLQLLFAIPVVGFVFLIVFSCSGANINRRNFARSYWCALLIGVIATVVILVLAAVLGVSLAELSGAYY